MADTSYGVNHALAVDRWARELEKEALKRTSFIQFVGTSSDSMIQLKQEMGKDAGDNITYGLRMQLSGTGISGDNTLEGNEEALTTFTDQLFIDQLRHAVRSAGKMSEQRVPFSVRDEARDGLADWFSGRYDQWLFSQLCGDGHSYSSTASGTIFTGFNQVVDAIGAADTDHFVMPNDQTTEAGIASTSASSVFTLSLIDRAVTKAKTISPLIRPFKIMGHDYYVAFLHPLQVEDLRTDAQTAGNWFDIQSKAMQGGDVTENPIFTGALGVYNNVVLHESTYVRPGNVTPSAGAVYRAVLCGAQAACLGYGYNHGPQRMEWVEELFDYGNKLGVAGGCIGGIKKTRFNSKDYGTVLMPTYTSNA